LSTLGSLQILKKEQYLERQALKGWGSIRCFTPFIVSSIQKYLHYEKLDNEQGWDCGTDEKV